MMMINGMIIEYCQQVRPPGTGPIWESSLYAHKALTSITWDPQVFDWLIDVINKFIMEKYEPIKMLGDGAFGKAILAKNK